MNNTDAMIKRLNFENIIWICFIIISVLDIYGDELIKKSLNSNDKKCKSKANKLFLGITLFSILIYFYFLMRNYNDCRKYNNESYHVRLIGSIFVLTGTICFLYFQLTTTFQTDSPSNV